MSIHFDYLHIAKIYFLFPPRGIEVCLYLGECVFVCMDMNVGMLVARVTDYS